MKRDDAQFVVDRPLTRRRLLSGAGLVGATLVAGCLGGAGGGGGGDPTPTPDPTTDGGGPGGDAGDGGDSGATPTDGTGGVGEVVRGTSASLVVEYVRPVDRVIDFREFPRTDDEATYGVPRTVDYFADLGFAERGSSLYGIGLAVKNTGSKVVDVSTVFAGSDAQPFLTSVFMGRSQRLAPPASGGVAGNVLVPGEVQRAEHVFALTGDPSGYALTLEPRDPSRGGSERLGVDLGRGSEATANFQQSARSLAVGETAAVGDLEVTLHEASVVDSVVESPYQDIFGPREGYRYLLLDLSATRKSDVMIGQEWLVGTVATDGYSAAFDTVNQDVMELNRDRLGDLAVGESIEHTKLAFPVADGFDPAYVSFTAPGLLEDPPQYGPDEGMFRSLWRI